MNEKTPKAPIGIENAYEVMEKIKHDAQLGKQPRHPAKAKSKSEHAATDPALPPTVAPDAGS